MDNKANAMLHSMVEVPAAVDVPGTDSSLKLSCDLLLLYFDKFNITSRSLESVIGLKWKTVKKRLKAGSVDYREIRILLAHCGIDPWRAMIAIEELKRPGAYFEDEIVLAGEWTRHLVRTVLERFNALNGDFIPLRRGLDSQTTRLVDDLFAHQGRFQDFAA